IMEPEAIGKLVGYFQPHQSSLTLRDAMYYTGVMLGLKLLHCFYLQNYVIFVQLLAIQIRTALCSLIYRKALKMTPSALQDISLGNIITIMTKDVSQFETAIWLFNDMWISSIEGLVVCYLLYAKVGVASLAGIGVLISVAPLEAYFGKVVKDMRMDINKKTDERLQITQESLSSIKIIKMYTWEYFFCDKIDAARKSEMNKMIKTFYLKILMFLTTIIGSKVGFYSLLMTYVYLNNNATAETMFYVMNCFINLRHSVTHAIALGVQRAAELLASINRIDSVLKGEELVESPEKHIGNPKVYMKDVKLTIKDKTVLENINVSLEKGLTVITGAMGGGKSSLIKTMLKDYPISEGVVETIGRKSYASQDPWIFPSSIKQNILFGEAYDQERYNEASYTHRINMANMETLLEHGDETIAADRGLNLSKGQQARINLARAVYKHSDIYFLDDSLTALDSRVQEFIYDECIKGFLKDKLCVLVTHNPKHIHGADKIIVLDNGTIKFQGSKHSAKSILPDLEKVDLNEKNVEKNNEIDVAADEKTELIGREAKDKKGIYHEIKKGRRSCIRGLLKFTESYISKVLTNWVNLQQNITDLVNGTEILAPKEVLVDIQRLELKASKILNVYSILILSFIVLELLKYYFVLKFAKNASVKLHRTMIEGIVFSVMSFFDNHFIGNILNRFAQDLTVVDERLPFVIGRLVQRIFSVAGVIVLIAVVNWKFFIPCSAFLLFLILLRAVYMPAARSLKRLESATRSPIVGYLNASMEGLTTIRAYEAQDILKHEFDRHQDLYTSASYVSFCMKRAFGFYMDFCSVMFLAIIIGRFLFFDIGKIFLI
ncbi:hypothetical protein NQ317_013654, partial [Molorchus minor]